MSMNSYVSMLNTIQDKILKNKLKHKNTIIIGDNSSGKSEILKRLFDNKPERYYFIDSVNRGFDYSIVSSMDNIEKETYKSVVNTRINNESKFNLEDSFDLYGDGAGVIEQIYYNYDDEVKSLFKSLLDCNFDIITESIPITGRIERKVIINGRYDKLSSGYQAIIRLLLELCYFKDSVKDDIGEKVVVIDEVNEFLSSKNEEKIIPFLMKYFNDMNFIITTHSAEVIATSIDCNIIALKGCRYECFDGNDFKSVTDAREIFSKIYETIDDEKDDDIEIIIRNLLNIKISGQWTELEEKELNSIDESKLSNAQKLLLNQIKSW